MTKHIMRSFKLNEISAVDRPAQEHAKVIIMKRDASNPTETKMDEPTYKIDVQMTDDIKKTIDAKVEEVRKTLGEQLKETSEKLAKAEAELIKANMTEAEFAYYEKASDSDKDAFVDMTPELRKTIMKKAIDDAIPEHVRKQLLEADDMKKRLASLEQDKAVASFAKHAAELGLEGHGETLRKTYQGDAEAITKLESMLKGLAEQARTGKIFAEFGANQSGAGLTAHDEIMAEAKIYRDGQSKVGKIMSPEQAFTAIYCDPAFAELKKRYDAEEMKKRRAA